MRGEEKRFEERSFREIGPRIVAAGLAKAADVATVADEVEALTRDEHVVYSLSGMTQVWATKQGGS